MSHSARLLDRFWKLFFLTALTAAAQTLPNPAFSVSLLIGTGSRGDGGPAAQALLDGPSGLAEDANGNIYIADSNAGVIRRVRPDGVIERFAGTGTLGDGDAGKPALQTDLSNPTVLLMDQDGGLLFADGVTCRIRKVQTDGTIANVAGTGRCYSASSGGFGSGGSWDLPALDTQIAPVGGMAIDSQGRLMFSETSRHQVRRVDTDGYVRTIAGAGQQGFYGDGGAATYAYLYYPEGLATDSSGNVYIADGYNCRIRQIDGDGNISTAVGANTCARTTASFNGGPGTALDRVGPLAYDAASNTLYIGLPRFYRVLRFDLSSSVLTPFLGNGRVGTAPAPEPLKFTLNEPSAILPSPEAGVLVAAATSYQVFQVQNDVAGVFAGQWPQLDSYPPASTAQLLQPRGVFSAPDGSLLVADAGANRLLQWQAGDQLSAVAGVAYPAGFTTGDNGPALQATLDQPNRVVRRGNGDIYFSEGSRIRMINAQGVIRTVRNSLDNPAGLVFDAQDRLVYSEAGRNRIVRLDLSANSTTVIAGTGDAGFSGDGGLATAAKLNWPGDLAFDSQGNLLIADRGNRRVRRITSDGKIQTIIGSGLPFSYGDISGRQALDTGFGSLDGLAVDANDNVYLSESLRVDMISPDGAIRVVTGFVSEDDSGNLSYIDGPLNGADGLAVDGQGRIYISARQDGRVLVATPAGQ